MPQAPRIRRSLLLALLSGLLLAGCSSAVADADSFGELQHFGAQGKALGDFTTTEAHVLGVDPTTNDVYVGDALKEGEFRIQKFAPGSAGEYEKSGKPVSDVSVTFSAKEVEFPELEGIAVDPQEEKIYALVVGEREALPVDSEEPAAYELFSFSTKGGKLEGGVLTSPATLKTESPTPGEALLEPSGITVDPVTHDVVLTGLVDNGLDSEGLPIERTAVQLVHASGTLGSRWIDQTNCFEEEGTGACEDAGGTPTSPVVTPTGRVYVLDADQIWEIPSTENKTTKELEFPAGLPKLAFQLEKPSGLGELRGLVNLPGTPFEGGGLSIAAEGADQAQIWAFARIKEDIPPAEGEVRSGALAIKWSEAVAGKPELVEEGWAGGAGASSTACKIPGSGARPVAAGKEQKVFVFDTTNSAPRIVELGKAGSGCPHTSVGTLKAQRSGVEVGTKTSPAHTADEVTLEATLKQGYAREVKWEFGNGETAVSHAYEYPTVKIVHKFASVGEHKVKATIETDDLALPALTTVVLNVLVSPSPPSPQFSFVAEPSVNQATTFDASISSDPNGAITSYVWNFGDGTPQVTSAQPTIAHTYTATGAKTVTLEVSDAQGQHATTSHELHIVSPSSSSPSAGTGSGSSGSSGSSSSTTPSTGTPVAKAPTGGVLSYLVKIAGSALTVSSSGAVGVHVACTGQSSCTGSVTLRTLTAVSAAAKRHKSVLTLAVGSFSLAGGHAKVVSLHLPSKAKRLLAKSHTLRVRATIVARDASGITHITVAIVTLKAAKPKH